PIRFRVGGPIHVGGFVDAGAGNALTIDATSPLAGGGLNAPVLIEGDVLTNGGALTVKSFRGIEVLDNRTVSTRQVAAGGDPLTDPSVAQSGAITFTVRNPDYWNPLVNLNGDFPHVTVGNGARLLAQATGGFAGGNVKLEATNTNFSLNALFFNNFAFVARASDVTLGTGAVVKGNKVDVSATSGDINWLGKGSKTWERWFDVVFGNVQQVLQLLPNAQVLNLPLSVVYRQAVGTVTVGANALIDAAGKVSLKSEAKADATGQAIYFFNTQFGASFAFTWADSTAATRLLAGAQVLSGGDVEVKADAGSTAAGTA